MADALGFYSKCRVFFKRKQQGLSLKASTRAPTWKTDSMWALERNGGDISLGRKLVPWPREMLVGWREAGIRAGFESGADSFLPLDEV